jgi:hypothetical protein
MNKYCAKLLLLIVVFLLLNNSYAEDISFTDEATIKEILFEKSLKCTMKELNYNGPEVIKIKKISGKKIVGVSNLWCHQKETRYTGKLKKNRMKWQQQDHAAPCYCRSGSLDFFRGDDGQVQAEGKYRVGCGATPVGGTIQCIVE